MKQPQQRFCADETGATLVEFAIVSSVFFMLLFAILEFGLFMFTKVQVEAITAQAVREVGVGNVKPGCADRVSCIIALINQKSVGLMHKQSVQATARVVSAGGSGAPPTPDICLDDMNNPYPAACGKWVENNPPGDRYNPATLDADAIGGAGELVEIRVTYLWRVLFPIFNSRFGRDGVLVITSTSVVKNEPF